MSKQPEDLPQSQSSLQLPWWFAPTMPAVNEDFDQRRVSLPETAHWQATQIPGIELRVLEYVPGDRPRLTGQIRLDERHSSAQLGSSPDLEILIQRGELSSSMGVYGAGWYLRLPPTDNEPQALTLHRQAIYPSHAERLTTPGDEKSGSSVASTPLNSFVSPGPATPQDTGPQSLLYIAVGQMPSSDTEKRRIDTGDESRWLPGPTPGTDVLPLHGHGTGNSMLIRWNSAVEIRPRLDPMGEELLVLSGTLHDALGHYPSGSWIRTPVEAWENWGAMPGTLVYYKTGHFPLKDH